MLNIINSIRSLQDKHAYVVLSKDGASEIDRHARRLLSEVGFKVEHPRMLSMLNGAGYNVHDKVVRVTPEQIEELLDAERKRRRPAVPPDEPGVYVGYLANQLYDADIDQVRYPTREDLDHALVVALNVPHVLGIGPLFEPKDCPLNMTDIAMLEIMLRRLPKPSRCEVLNISSIPAMLKMCAVAAGSIEKALHREMLIQYAFITSPLMYDHGTIELAFAALDQGIPVRFGAPMTIAGASGPITFAGTLTVCLAEAYTGLVLSSVTGQCWEMGMAPVVMDQATGVTQYAGPDRILLSAATLDLARYLGTAFGGPFIPHLASDATKPGLLAGIEKVCIAMLCLLGGSQPIIVMAGQLGPGGLVGSIEQVLIDAEIIGMLDRLVKGIEVSKETIAYDLIARIGIGGSFLSEEHTVEHFRNELWFPTLIKRLSPSAWNEEKADMLGMARKRVKDILASHDPRALTPEQEKDITAIAQHEYEKAG